MPNPEKPSEPIDEDGGEHEKSAEELTPDELESVTGGQKNVTTIKWSPLKIRTGTGSQES